MNTLQLELTKGLVHTVGRLSDGISLCLKEGLTSGLMLDYVYRNKPRGKFLIGKALDRIFLSNTGWKSIRERKELLVSLLIKAIDNTPGKEVFLADVASGAALYDTEAAALRPLRNVRILCRDMDERWFKRGAENAAEKGVRYITFEKADALSKESFKSLPSAPDIMVSSGFYDWIHDDTLIKKSMQLIFSALKDGGYFVFTNQCGHFDLQMTNYVFPHLDHGNLSMKTRPAEEVNAWAVETGFEIVENKISSLGHYSVVLARKRG